MSINFDDPMNDEARSEMMEMFSDKIAGMDERTALINESEFTQKSMGKLANIAKQVATLEVHKDGEIKTLSDGTRYQVTPSGWVKL